MSGEEILHATCVAIGDAGVVIRGAPGSGKSDLALRLIDQPGLGAGPAKLSCKLVSDDQTYVHNAGGQLIASAPEALRGLLEVRGVGIVQVPYIEQAQVVLALRLTGRDRIERMPDLPQCNTEILGVSIPELELDPFAASAPAKLRAVMANFGDLFYP